MQILLKDKCMLNETLSMWYILIGSHYLLIIMVVMLNNLISTINIFGLIYFHRNLAPDTQSVMAAVYQWLSHALAQPPLLSGDHTELPLMEIPVQVDKTANFTFKLNPWKCLFFLSIKNGDKSHNLDLKCISHCIVWLIYLFLNDLFFLFHIQFLNFLIQTYHLQLQSQWQ